MMSGVGGIGGGAGEGQWEGHDIVTNTSHYCAVMCLPTSCCNATYRRWA